MFITTCHYCAIKITIPQQIVSKIIPPSNMPPAPQCPIPPSSLMAGSPKGLVVQPRDNAQCYSKLPSEYSLPRGKFDPPENDYLALAFDYLALAFEPEERW